VRISGAARRPLRAAVLSAQHLRQPSKVRRMRRASSRVSSFTAERRPGSSSKYTYASACPVLSRAIKQALFASSMVHGGGKRRMGAMKAPFPLCAESDAQPS
jgi:hypothetical protein